MENWPTNFAVDKNARQQGLTNIKQAGSNEYFQ